MATHTEQSKRIELDPQQIASYALQDPKHPQIELSQVKHRIALIKAWGIRPGRVLEIGCGQGNCTTVLAEAVGPHGHVDAVDPAPGDYGAPFTLDQAQGHISKSSIGDRITWHRADPLDFLQNTDNNYDFVVLSHCIWYFKSTEILPRIFEMAKGKASRIVIAEYALDHSDPTGFPHVLAAMTRASAEMRKDSTANVQNIMGPTTIKNIAAEKGLKLDQESIIVPDPELDDGRWEVGEILHSGFLEEIDTLAEPDRVKWLLRSMRDSVIAAVAKIGIVKNVSTMDVWAGSFIR